MPNATFAQINTQLYNILDLLDGDGKPLQVVYDYPESAPSGFPCAFPVCAGARESTEDTQYNMLAVDFKLRFIFLDSNDQDMNDLMLDSLQTILAELRKNDHFTLSNPVERFEVSPNIEAVRTSLAESKVILFDIDTTSYTLQDTTL